jgi:hypothetical protein
MLRVSLHLYSLLVNSPYIIVFYNNLVFNINNLVGIAAAKGF